MVFENYVIRKLRIFVTTSVACHLHNLKLFVSDDLVRFCTFIRGEKTKFKIVRDLIIEFIYSLFIPKFISEWEFIRKYFNFLYLLHIQ